MSRDWTPKYVWAVCAMSERYPVVIEIHRLKEDADIACIYYNSDKRNFYEVRAYALL